MPQVAVIGAGLAGCEAALVLAAKGIPVVLYEMRPFQMTPAHTTGFPAELVCSNSFKSDQRPSAHGLLKRELLALNSPLLAAAYKTRVKAGSALAVDRLGFSGLIQSMLEESPLITIERQECKEPPAGFSQCLIATGPLTSESLATWLTNRFSAKSLSFYDAIAPIVATDSIDFSRAFYASRWDDDTADYCNCPFTKDEYDAFYAALTSAEVVKPHPFEKENFFQACQPIETLAGQGYRTLLFGPLRPVGIVDPATGKRPYAVCQLRRENAAGDCMNMVGFQSRMTIPFQRQVLRMIPGLKNAEFVRYGSIHRNTYLNSPALLNRDLSFVNEPDIFCAGQLCGNEGYTESIATGHLAALFMAARYTGKSLPLPPSTTACGSILRFVTLSQKEKQFSPSNINYSLIDPADTVLGRVSSGERKEMIFDRGERDMKEWIDSCLQP